MNVKNVNQRLKQPIRVITVDDHEILRGGLKYLLLAFDDIELVGEARNGEEAVRLCQEVQPNVVLMDLMMPGMNGAQTTQAIRQRYPQIRVLVLTSFEEIDLLRESMQAGASGYLLKGVSIDQLAQAIRSAATGQYIISAEAMQALLETPQASPQPICELTYRQKQVLELLTQGLSNDAIAEQINVSPSTVRHHVSQVLCKLGAANRTEAATLAARHGLSGG